MRRALIDAAARVIVNEGPRALTVRRLTGEVGASTIAVYTYFDGIDGLRAAVAVEGFSRLSRRIGAVSRTEDPVADVAVMGGAYLRFGMENRDLYRLIFGARTAQTDAGTEAFQQLIVGAERAIEAGRFDGEAAVVARQLWVTTHGITSLQLADLLTADQAFRTLAEMGRNLFVGLGDDPQAAAASIRSATERVSAARR